MSINAPNNKRVVITGLGLVSSIGIGKDDFWNNLLKGISGIGKVSSFDTSAFFTHYGGEVNEFNPLDFIPKEQITLLSRATQMALAAAKLSATDANLSLNSVANDRSGICCGTTTGSIQVIEIINDKLIDNRPVNNALICQLPTQSTPGIIAKELGLTGPNAMFSSACAAGNYAIGYGFDLIRLNRADLVFAGAADAFSRISFTGFNQFSAIAPEKCQPFDMNRKGMMVGEGAGILVLESLENALMRKAPIYAEILGYGLSCDAYHMTAASIEGIAECMKKAMLEANITVDSVDYISAHGTGTRANDRIECAATKEIFGPRQNTIPMSSIKSMLGHAMGAASALEAIACSLSVKNDVIPPTINFETLDPECNIDCVPNNARKHTVNIALNNSYAFGGNNACLVLSKLALDGEDQKV
jgi:3-oxoacyl-[acyl-carrier-protein] synthase II